MKKIKLPPYGEPGSKSTKGLKTMQKTARPKAPAKPMQQAAASAGVKPVTSYKGAGVRAGMNAKARTGKTRSYTGK